jgi:hypothetical protein
MLAGREVVIEALLIIDKKRGAALLIEGRQAFPLAPRLFEPDALAHNLRHGEAGAQLIEELGRKPHGTFRSARGAQECGTNNP